MSKSVNDRPPPSIAAVSTVVDLLIDRGRGSCAEKGYTFFQGDGVEDKWLRYGDLDRAAVNISKQLRTNPLNLDDDLLPRAVILCPPGEAYLRALFGTLYSGMTVVTAYPPRPRRADERLDHIVSDSGATVALVDQSIFERRDQILKTSPQLGRLKWFNVDDLANAPTVDQARGSNTLAGNTANWTPPNLSPDSLAVLQYTSGSTSDPKGVCLSHGNLLANLQMIYEAFEIERYRDHWSVTWLPPYHDMGLIGGLLQVLYAGRCTHVMPPASFIQKPVRWLQAISKYKASVSGGPNFAFDTCVDRIRDADLEGLDLSHWTLAFTGAEPVRENSLQRFADRFSSIGFQSSAFFPCYGLAEATLLVTGGPRGEHRTDSTAPSGVVATGEVVSCGAPAGDQVVVCADPETLRELPDGEVGEVCVSGAHVSQGYWQRADSEETFAVEIQGRRERFLRTGDLGYLRDGQLYVTGRLKELIIVRGRNLQPSDVEASFADVHPKLVPNASVAFEIEVEDASQLVIVQEIERCSQKEREQIITAIRERVVEAFDVQPYRVVLIAKRALPKTSSGKVKRLATRDLYLAKTFDGVASRGPAEKEEDALTFGPALDAPRKVAAADVSAWLVERIAKHLGLSTDEIDVTRPFTGYGIDSVSAVQMVAELESHLGRPIPATLMYEAPTITAVAQMLSAEASDQQIDHGERQPEVVGASNADAQRRSGAIAIVGAACRLPRCESLDDFWQLLVQGRNVIADPPAARREAINGQSNIQRAGWMEDVSTFDAALFSISPREAKQMDPQHRLLLETCWRSLEDATLDPNSVGGRNMGVFVGIANRDYERLILASGARHTTYSMTGNAASMAAHRLSYHFDLRGPSLSIDTACSSSLVALHQAVRAIQSGDCESAVVAGVNLILSPEVSETLTDGEMLSPDGLCKTFDASANGYGRGEGCIAVVLKPLEAARRDGDLIRAVIEGTAINQDGLTNGITAPSGDAQQQLYRNALADAALEPSAVSRIEAHGTGTILGDPIEFRSLNQVYGRRGQQANDCFLGAVKANLGHLESAAGLASLLKVVLELEHGEVVSQPNLAVLNPHIDLDESRLSISTTNARWDDSTRRRAAVSSFGFGGTNAHVIVGQGERPKRAPKASPTGTLPSLITLSSGHVEGLADLARQHGDVLRQSAGELDVIAQATQYQRSSLRHRVAVVGSSKETVAERLTQFAEGKASEHVCAATALSDRAVSIAMLFTGQGGQHVGMGQMLYRHLPTFRKWIDCCDELLRDEFDHSITDLIASSPETNGAVAELLNGPAAQTSLFSLQLALAKTFEQFGAGATTVLGHSMGEFAAAAISGVMTWEDALRLTAVRARHVSLLSQAGAMTVVFDSAESVQHRINELGQDLSIAAIDAPEHIVVSGASSGIAMLQDTLAAAGTTTRPLRINQAFHSSLMDPVLEPIKGVIESAKLSLPEKTYISSLTGQQVTSEVCSPNYWTRHSREPVQYVRALESLAKSKCDVAIEIGPHPTLCTLGQLNSNIPIDYLQTLVRGQDDLRCVLTAVGELFCRGVELDWDEVNGSRDRSEPSNFRLPGYPFQPRSYWLDDAKNDAAPSIDTDTIASSVTDRQRDRDCHGLAEELESYAAAKPEVDQLVARYMYKAFETLGLADRDGQVVDLANEVAVGRIAAKHLRLAERICEILADQRWLEPIEHQSTRSWRVVGHQRIEASQLCGAVAPLRQKHPSVTRELKLVARCGSKLASVLAGQTDPLEVLFPGGDASDLESLYRASPVAQVCNQTVADAVVAAIDTQLAHDPSRPIRVLEIGGGTGGTTSFVWPAIKDKVESYVFTDVSPLLVAEASGRFESSQEASGSLEFQVLDIESTIESQGFEEDAFDIVIAANVFHATSDLKRTLSNANRLLRSGGLLVALEGVRPEPMLDLIFGLTEGWWRFEDSELRPNYPLIDSKAWLQLLNGCGYRDPAILAPDASLARVQQGQAVLVATGVGDDSRPQKATSSQSASRSLGNRSAQRAGKTRVDLSKWVEAFQQSSNVDGRRAALEDYFRHAVAAVLEHDPAEIDIDQPVSNLGIDSLMAIQLKNRLSSELELSVPMVAFLEGKSLTQLMSIALDSQEVDPRSIVPRGDRQEVSVADRVASDLATDPSSQRQPQTTDIATRRSPSTGERVLGPMSVGQTALWLIHQRAPEGPAYNFAFAAQTSRTIDRDAMTKACRSLVKRHPVLRTRYRLDGDAAVRVLSDSIDVEIAEKDCQDWKRSRMVDWIRDQADAPFDLQDGPVIRFTLLRCRKGDVLSIAMHHIAADLWSMDVLIQELLDLYAMIVGGGTIDLGTLPTTYDAYVDWERGLDTSEEGEQLWRFWQRKLEGAPHVLELPTTYQRPAEQTFNGKSLEWTVPTEVVESLRDVAVEERTTLFTIVLAAYQTFLSRICGQDDLLVGTVSASRGRSEWEGIVGYFLNQLVLRTRINGSPTFRDVLRDSQREVLDALQHQALPFAKLVEKVRPLRDTSRSPLIQTMFIWDKPRHLKESHFAPGKSSDRLRLKPLLMEQRGAPFDLTLIVFELEDELKLTFRYNTDLFSDEAIESLSQSFNTLIDAIAINPDVPIRTAPLLSLEQQECITRWNDTHVDFDPDHAGDALLRQWAKQTPDAIALESESAAISYRQLDQRVDSVAARLLSAGTRKGDIVGLLAGRGVESIIGIMAAWRAGAAYVPLDPAHPRSRLQAIFADASPDVVLTDQDQNKIDELALGGYRVVVSIGGDEARFGNSERVALPKVTHDDLAYLIYTSGSTGKPKGTVLTHRGIANMAVAQRKTFGIQASDKCLQFSSLHFDASVFEIILALHAGATLYVIDPGVVRSSTGEITDQLRRSNVNVATLPPSVLSALSSDDLPALHTVISAGEACSAQLVDKWIERAGNPRRMFNAYGPTETTVWASTHQCSGDGTEPSLGQPVSNVRIEIVDGHLEPMPIGVPGELCISGPGLALEYFGRPELTADVFVPNPFSDAFDASMYRSGDRARWTTTGEVEFLGRIDDQVKVDGNRIEPGEIAAVMRAGKSIKDAHVLYHSGIGLVGYYLADRPRSSDADDASFQADLRKHVASHLPCYMVPKAFVGVDAFPLTVSGKLDATRLPDPSDAVEATEAVPPSTPTEKVIAAIWCKVLNVPSVGIHDNFFELGGASLQALQAAELAMREGFSVSAERMFQFQTVAELAAAIDADGPAAETQAAAEPDVLGQPIGQQTIDSVAQEPSRSTSLKMTVESLGTYLPPATETTDEVIEGCQKKLEFPLERMTGIQSRHVAGETEFAIDLAFKAAISCLENSRFEAGEIDSLIACNISRYDGPDFEVSYEPSTASKLKQRLGATSALAFDVCNACAGFFTALSIAEDQLRSGQAARVMIVSGEYITHLTKTAQKEIEGFLDPRLACLTLGDAGAAVIVELTDSGYGFESLDLYTDGRHHDLCVAKVTDRPHGGAIMYTDAVKASAVTLDLSVNHAHRSLVQRKWRPDEIQHVIMHQTSTTTLDGAIEELNRHFDATVCDHKNTVNNLTHRGNTASTTHWVAVMDMILGGRIQKEDRAVFAISGSGQTIGTALYTFDSLPERIADGTKSSSVAPITLPNQLFGTRIVATSWVKETQEPNLNGSIESAVEMSVVRTSLAAASKSLASVDWQASDVDMLIHAGVYRDEFLSEPAVAAIVSGELGMAEVAEGDSRGLAYDLTDSSRGPLVACSLVAGSLRTGAGKRALITASETENNDRSFAQYGLVIGGSAIAIERTDNASEGFGEFFFKSYPEHAGKLVTRTRLVQRVARLEIERSDDLEETVVACLIDAVDDFLGREGTSIAQFNRVLVTTPTRIAPIVVAQALGIDVDAVVAADSQGSDAFTSTIAIALGKTLKTTKSETWLLVSVGAGIEVGCVAYGHLHDPKALPKSARGES